MGPAGDDAERSDEEKRLMGPAGDDAERSDEEKRLMSSSCRDCRAGLEHCHGTLIHHWLHRSECTDHDCAGPELLPHTFVVDCDAVGCECAFIEARPALAI